MKKIRYTLSLMTVHRACKRLIKTIKKTVYPNEQMNPDAKAKREIFKQAVKVINLADY